METFLKKYLYFHRNNTYSKIINNDIKDIFTLKAVLIKVFFDETFSVKGKSEILKYFFFILVPPIGGARIGRGARPTLSEGSTRTFLENLNFFKTK